MRILVLFIFLISTAQANDLTNIKNIVIHKVPKTYENVFFLNKKNEKIKIRDLKGKLLILNFWATWCPPCKKEMPSLDNLEANPSLNNLKVFPINIGKEKIDKVDEFFVKLNLKNLEPFFDPEITLAKTFSLRGVPTSIFINKEGKEFARVLGDMNFNDKNFLKWIENYN
tara:strand:+ start:56 stop:565 length:510 start_codon:yes stop_codon:yes gene_type:complete